MPPSQLKRLKASLREQGVVGPQQSKKQRKQNAQNGANKEKRVHKKVALEGIREQFNPFEFKLTGKAPKFEVTTNRKTSAVVRRPGVAKGLAEERLARAYEEDVQRRKKVGGIVDKRFGENDPTMAPEDKMLERFTLEKQRRHKNNSAFDLEDDDMPGELTHMGQSLSLDGPALKDDFDEKDLELSDEEDHPSDDERARKRRRSSAGEDEEDEEDDEERPERKKSKQEVMKELIAKSKLHKYERQAAKDDDEDLREELDQEMSDIHALLRGAVPKSQPPPPAPGPGMNPDRAALLSGTDKVKLDKDYDLGLRQMAQDKRSQPTERTKTEDERVEEESRKLQELEAKRQRRMEGAPENSDEEDAAAIDGDEEEDDFGLGSGLKARPTATEIGVEDEDDFLIDDDLVASGSDLELSEGDSSDEEAEEVDNDEEDTDFLKSLLTEEEARRPEFLTGANGPLPEAEIPEQNGVNGDLAYTFKCPQSHEELLQITKGVSVLDLPTVVQRIRALYHPKLNSENKAKLGKFAVSLVDHISYLANQPQQPPFLILETLIRHIHSLAKTYPVEIANTFRSHLKAFGESRSLSPTAGDLVILTAIGTVFPTSDHFHQVVTPAILTMSRYLGLKIPQTLSDYSTGAYICTLCLQYQRISKRYVPEVMNFIENSLCVLAPTKLAKLPGSFPYHEPKVPVRIAGPSKSIRRLTIYDCVSQELSGDDETSLKAALLETNLSLLGAAADTWADKSSFTEVFTPASKILQHLSSKTCRPTLSPVTQTHLTKLTQKLTILLKNAHMTRRPLELHHHRPLAIKTAIPKFEESYNPDKKHYDADKERVEAAKLRKEFKREKKGAMRELRKDAAVVARESLREKRERDAAYEKKYKKLVAEIQGEEGHEAKAYEREKEWRKKGKK
ncbi:putative nucleolar complex protein 14 [Lachnellula arida]|uniref:Putative nucleolar complex protein 14 n=1 Tax=Lachnellula arida TaxID=1316785 RepID=A0A8T9BNG3_9HELO|nr:putative nucleolar complex protein 14 [Lachnellula arida]